ncbi:MAG TPA: hypothetical protein VED17_08935 [Nitrososphaerales archaeon]|nr:hypothetical protein [Nitrososphaerales archaeon]
MSTIEEQNANVIRKLWGELHGSGSKASLEMMTSLMDENIDWEVVPLGIKRHGIEEMKELIQGSWNDMPEGGYHEITNIFSTKEWVCLARATWICKGRSLREPLVHSHIYDHYY